MLFNTSRAVFYREACRSLNLVRRSILYNLWQVSIQRQLLSPSVSSQEAMVRSRQPVVSTAITSTFFRASRAYLKASNTASLGIL